MSDGFPGRIVLPGGFGWQGWRKYGKSHPHCCSTGGPNLRKAALESREVSIPIEALDKAVQEAQRTGVAAANVKKGESVLERLRK